MKFVDDTELGEDERTQENRVRIQETVHCVPFNKDTWKIL